MSKEWQLKSIDELATVSRGRSKHRPRNESFLYGGSYPFVQTADIHSSDLYINTFSKTYSDLGLAQSKLWKPGILCITNAGENTGDCAILDIEACFPDSIIAVTPDPEKADVFFLKYSVDRIKHQLRGVTKGATQDNLSVSKLVSFQFPVPPLQTQKRIGGILRSYGDLIENNRRRIQLLEESARLLYKEWFVHLRFPGHEHVAIANGIPEGWEKKKLEDLAYLNYGKALKADNRIPGPYPVYGSSGIVGTHQKALVKGPGIIVGRKGNVGSIFWSDADFYPIDTVYFINAEFSNFYLYYTLLNIRFINTDVAVPGLNRDFAHSRKVLFPTKQLRELFEEFVAPLHKQIMILQKECEALEKARDILLPRLMNGDIAV